MRITIAQRYKPFSHLSGTVTILPGTDLRVQVFPALVRIGDDIEKELPVKGPVKGFTVQNDLEKNLIRVWGEGSDGVFFRYAIQGKEGNIVFQSDKGEPELLCKQATLDDFSPERLSLGCHKAQDWEMVCRRGDLAEIMPLWLRMGQRVPQQVSATGGTTVLLDRCREAIEQKDREHILDPFYNLLLAGFDGVLCPRLTDTDHQGFELPKAGSGLPIALLSQGASLIRSLFVQRSDNEVHLLPLLPVPFHCGRMAEIRLGDSGEMDFEWSKKTIRRLVFRSEGEGTQTFHFQKSLKTCRLSRGKQDRGVRIPCPAVFEATPGETYYFDNFQ